MTTIDKRAAIAALQKALDNYDRTEHGVRLAEDRDALWNAAKESPAQSAEPAAPAPHDERTDADLLSIAKEVAEKDDSETWAADCVDQWLHRDVCRMLVRLSREAEPAAPAGDDEARIAEWSKMFALNTRGETRGDPSYDAAARAVGKWNTVCDTAVALMREFLARTVEAEAEASGALSLMRAKEAECAMATRRAEFAEAKLAAAEKARDAAIASQNARAVEELEGLVGFIIGLCRKNDSRDLFEKRIRQQIAALRSSPPAAPAGEAPAQGAGDDVLREVLVMPIPELMTMEQESRAIRVALLGLKEVCRRELARGER